LRSTLDTLSRKSDTAAAILYALKLWPALLRYCGDGVFEIDNPAAERAVCGVAIGRRNDLFSGADSGGERAAANEPMPRNGLEYGPKRLRDPDG